MTETRPITFEAKITVTFTPDAKIEDDDTMWEEAGAMADDICSLVKSGNKNITSIDISGYEGCYLQ